MGLFSAVHSSRIANWLGQERVESMSRSALGWYGPPIPILDMPGIYLHGDGDFSGVWRYGGFFSAADAARDAVARLWRAAGRMPALGLGFTTVNAATERASSGYRQFLGNGPVTKVGTAGTTNAAMSYWYGTGYPGVGATPAALPGGTVHTSATTGAMSFTDPSGSDTLHLTRIDALASQTSGAVLYDRLWAGDITMNSTATQSVTGVPTRYQDAIGARGNFVFFETRTVLPATAHNWTTCLYTREDGTTGRTLPSVTGVSACAANRMDQDLNRYFCPLASGDGGIRAVSQVQCSAAVATGAVGVVLGHLIAMIGFQSAVVPWMFDFTSPPDFPQIQPGACLALIQTPMSSATATTITGHFTAVSAPP